MIALLDEQQFTKEFFAEFAELECGDHYQADNPQHIDWVRRRIASHYMRGGRFYVHRLDDGTATGFVAAIMDQGPEGARCFGQMAELLDVIVREEHRGNGYGRELLDHVEAEARTMGMYCVYVATYSGNDDSMTFYINRGYVPVAMHPDIHGPDDDGDVYLRKILADAPS